jgi:hypothetical protein
MAEFDKLELKDSSGNVLIRLDTPVGSISPVKVAEVISHKFIGVSAEAGKSRHIIRNEDLEGFAVCLLSVLGYKVK